MPEENDEINAILNIMAYEYDLKMQINGIDPGITGGMSESKRILFTDSGPCKEMPEEMRKEFCLLNFGENEITLEYKKKNDRPSNLSIEFMIEGFPIPHLYIYSEEKEGKLTTKVNLEKEYTETLKPIVSYNNDEKKAGFMFLGTMGCTIGGTLNGTKQPTNTMFGSMPLAGVKEGQNKLELFYQGDPATTKEIKFAVATPEWAKTFVKKIEDMAEKTETLEFNA